MFAAILKQLIQRYTVHSSLPRGCQGTIRPTPTNPRRSKAQNTASAFRGFGVPPLGYRPLSQGVHGCRCPRLGASIRWSLIQVLKDLLALQRCAGFNLLATSRHIPDIQRQFKENGFYKIAADEEDVQSHVDDQLGYMQDFVQDDPKLQNAIKRAISKAHGGMFRVAAAHLTTLAEQPTIGDLELPLLELLRGF